MSNTTLTSIPEKLIQLGFQLDTSPADSGGHIRTVRDWQIGTSVAASNVFVDVFNVKTNECYSKHINIPAKYWEAVNAATSVIESAEEGA